MTDLDYMKLAYKLAQKGRGKTSPNPMVGAVLVKANKVIAQGWHARCGADHAEVMVFKKAGQRARGAKLYVTLEPCYTVGRTPPCVNAVVANQIKEVIIGTKDPNPQTHGKSIQKLRRAGINTRVGFLRSELESLNEAFFKYQKYRMPFVTAKCAQTLDGKIATVTGDSKWITSKKTREFSRKKRNEFDAIIVGINTVLKDNPSLNPSLKTKRLKKIIIDSSLRIPMNAKLFRNTKPEDCILATTDQASSRKIKMLANRGFRVDVTRKQDHRVNLRSYFHRLEIGRAHV